MFIAAKYEKLVTFQTAISSGTSKKHKFIAETLYFYTLQNSVTLT